MPHAPHPAPAITTVNHALSREPQLKCAHARLPFCVELGTRFPNLWDGRGGGPVVRRGIVASGGFAGFVGIARGRRRGVAMVVVVVAVAVAVAVLVARRALGAFSRPPGCRSRLCGAVAVSHTFPCGVRTVPVKPALSACVRAGVCVCIRRIPRRPCWRRGGAPRGCAASAPPTPSAPAAAAARRRPSLFKKCFRAKT